MKKIFYFLFTVMLCGGFVGCGKDDDSKNSLSENEKLLVGMWENYKTYDGYYREYIYFEEGEYRLRFDSDGTGYVYNYEDRSDKFSWYLVDNRLYIHAVDEGEEINDIATIKSLLKTELILVDVDFEEYYRKVK